MRQAAGGRDLLLDERRGSPGTRHGLNAAALSLGCEGFFDGAKGVGHTHG